LLAVALLAWGAPARAEQPLLADLTSHLIAITTGFTGTSVWLDPGSDTYVILLANSILVRGSPPLSKLRGDVATAAAQALRL